VHETLLPFCSYLDSEAQPSVVAVANVQHLGTMVEGRLSDPPPSVLELALLLHPTPAVAGEPRAAALALIDELEVGDRGLWAGAVGWVDAAGDGSWMVAIRSAQLSGREARLWAGNGIVVDSDPATELEETRAKLDAVLPLLVRP
jgi:isochorismate synthase EntC